MNTDRRFSMIREDFRGLARYPSEAKLLTI
jgi:hypothetical protein